ncbi:MAG: SGNH/GDSL hydrolase family protein [Defluviitaleaceae bacterium]|nr:SGNH/GDSL hydrolase family protein [Defluviitaleaceae bacterium]
MRKIMFKILASITTFALVFFALQRLLMPTFADPGTLEGGMIREYYRSNFDHDVIFIGDCEVYANFSPITLWEEFGITSHIRGTPQQLVWQSYYLLHDTLRFETPRVVVFNVLSMQYNEPQSRYYNRLTLDGMRWGMPKIRAIQASRTDDEGWLSYIFPFFRYKDRWRELSANDFRYFLRDPQVSINGFMLRADTVPAGWFPQMPPRGNYAFGDNAWDYLNRMVALTTAHDIELVLVKSPAQHPPWPPQWNQQIVDFAEANDLRFINFLEHQDEIGLNFQYHTFNAGLHLNVFGAELLARFFGGILQAELNLPDRRHEPDTAQHWHQLSELYHRNIARQLAEIDRYGRVQCFLIR